MSISLNSPLADSGGETKALKIVFTLVIAAIFSATVAAAEEMKKSPLPLAAAYSQPVIVSNNSSTGPEPSLDGKHIAFTVKYAQAEVGDADLFTQKDLPTDVFGSQIMLADVEKRTAAQLCKIEGNSWRPSWSPDASSLAFYADFDGVMKVWVYDREAQECSKAGNVLPHPLGHKIHWSPNGRELILSLVPDETPIGFYHGIERARRAQKPEDGVVVFEHKSGNIELSPDGSKKRDPTDLAGYIDMMSRSSIVALDIQSGKSRKLVSSSASSEPGGQASLSVSGKWIAFPSIMKTDSADRSAITHDIHVTDLKGKKTFTIAMSLPVRLGSVNVVRWSWNPVKDQLAYIEADALYVVNFSANRLGSKRRLLSNVSSAGAPLFTRDGQHILVPIENFEITKRQASTVPISGLALVSASGGDPKVFAINKDHWRLEGVVSHDDNTLWQPNSHSFSVRLRDITTNELVVKRFSELHREGVELWRGRAHFDSLFASDDNQLFGIYEDITTPRELYEFAPDFAEFKRLSEINPVWDQYRGSALRMINSSIPTYDHSFKTVSVAVIVPEDYDGKSALPAIVMIYPNSDFSRQADRFAGGHGIGLPAHVFTSRGYAVVYPYVATGPGGETGNIVSEIVDSLLPQIYAAAEAGIIDRKRLALYGNSFGGFATAAVVTRTNLFRAAIPANGIYDLANYVYADAPDGHILWAETSQPRLGGHLWTEQSRYIRNSPFFQADQIQTPILIMQGGDDWLRPESEKFYTALRRLDKDAELAIYERSGHQISEWPLDQSTAATERILKFLQAHLGKP